MYCLFSRPTVSGYFLAVAFLLFKEPIGMVEWLFAFLQRHGLEWQH